MKHLLYCMAILCFSHTSEAQRKIAIKGGWNYSTARIYYNDVKQPSAYKSGFGLGIQFKVPFEGKLNFSPSISYSMRGYKYAPTETDTAFFDNTIHYVDIVPALSMDFPIGKNVFFVAVGPQLSVAISGKEKTTTRAGETKSGNMKFSTSSDYGIVDLGMNFATGYAFNKFLIEASYQLGLANINNDIGIAIPQYSLNYIDPRNIRHKMLSLKIGYYIK